MSSTIDMSGTILANSDQLNAADLAEPIVVQITKVRKIGTDPKQPIEVEITGGYKPWRPCLTSRRMLVAIWGADGAKYVGKWVRLYNDPEVVYGGKKTGGIRISGASGISQTFTLNLPTNRGKYALFTVEPIQPPAASSRQDPPEVAELRGYLTTRIGIIDPPLTDSEKKTLFAALMGIAHETGTNATASLKALSDLDFIATIKRHAGRQ